LVQPPHEPRAHPADEPLLTTTQMEGTMVVTIACQNLREGQASDLRDRLECIAEEAGWRVAVCLAGVSVICSTCLTELVLIHQRCRAQGGSLVVCNLKRSLRDMLSSTGLFDALPLADNLPDALILCRRAPEKAGFLNRFRRTRAA
jgi:anti-anti-sigma factor